MPVDLRYYEDSGIQSVADGRERFEELIDQVPQPLQAGLRERKDAIQSNFMDSTEQRRILGLWRELYEEMKGLVSGRGGEE